MALHNDLKPMDAFLRQFAGTEVLFLPNVGNAGDSLIAAGTYQAFRRAGVSPTIILNNSDDVGGKTVFLGGGGNLVPLYIEMRCAIEQFLENGAARLIILPHTIRGNEDILRRLPKNTIIFCRDPISYSHVSENSDASLYLDHDMAFHLDVDEFAEWCKRYPDAPGLFERHRAEIERVVQACSGEGRFLRRDGEKSKMLTFANTIDLSASFQFGTRPDNAEKASYCLFKGIECASHVVTDRLHLAIACGLLHRNCGLFDNFYGKNRGVYFHSIKRILSTVTFFC
jgi:exopolysaccharide biosynthesis predicted pyruvyltransferase EpsI